MKSSGGHPHKKEATNTTARDNKTSFVQLFKEVGCYNFLQKTSGLPQVAKAFVKSFNGVKAQVGLLQIQVNVQRILEVTEIPMTGENWFKNTSAKDINYQQFLIEAHQDLVFHKDIPRSYLQEESQQLLKLIQSYITSEGRYGRTFIYHFRL